MLSVTYTAALSGLEGYLVTVECSGQNNLPLLDIVGLPDMAVREARQRVKAACESCGIPFPDMELVVNLAPANRRKEGSAFDLAMLTAILQCGGIIPRDISMENYCFIGELSLSGHVREVCGVLNMTLSAYEAGKREIFVPVGNVAEAAAVEGMTVYGVPSIGALIDHDSIIEEGCHLAPGAIVKAENRIPAGMKVESGTVIENRQYPL